MNESQKLNQMLGQGEGASSFYLQQAFPEINSRPLIISCLQEYESINLFHVINSGDVRLIFH